jgi:uncharacterized cupredoxin-like copper-binding protein
MISLTACGDAGTPTPQPPAATSTVPQVQPLATQAPSVSDIPTTDPAIPDMSMTDTPMIEPADTPTLQSADTPTSSVPSQTTSVTATPAGAAETDVQATLIEWSIKLSQSEVPAGKVVFTVTNQGTMMHNLTVEDDSGVIGRTHNFGPSDGPQTLALDLTPGTYTVICSLPGHAQRGQRATLVVTSQ